MGCFQFRERLVYSQGRRLSLPRSLFSPFKTYSIREILRRRLPSRLLCWSPATRRSTSNSYVRGCHCACGCADCRQGGAIVNGPEAFEFSVKQLQDGFEFQTVKTLLIE